MCLLDQFLGMNVIFFHMEHSMKHHHVHQSESLLERSLHVSIYETNEHEYLVKFQQTKRTLDSVEFEQVLRSLHQFFVVLDWDLNRLKH